MKKDKYLLIVSSHLNKEFDQKRALYAYELNDIFKVYRLSIKQTGTVIFYIVGTREQFDNYGFQDDIEKLKLIPKEICKQLEKLDDYQCCIKLASIK